MTVRAAVIMKLIFGHCKQEALMSQKQDFLNVQNAVQFTGNTKLYILAF